MKPLNMEEVWKNYLNYLSEWINNHLELKEHFGKSPMNYYEWFNDKYMKRN